jgi:replicative DNA helicase
VDLVTLSDALERQGQLESVGGIEYLTQLANVMPSSANYQTYLDIVTRDSLLRKLIKGSASIIEECQKSTDKGLALAYAEKTVYDISNEEDTSEMVRLDNIMPEVMSKLDELSKDKSSAKGIKTTYRDLDNMINGVHKSDLMILAARPAVGKTSLAMNLVEHIALQGYSCAVFSLEMGREQLGQRLICSVAGVSMSNAVKGKLNKTEWLKIAKAKEKLHGAKVFIDDSAMITPREMLSKCRRLKNRFGLDFVMVDYIQLMSPDKSKNSDNRQTEVSEISRNLKIMAKELNVPVLALSQLSRNAESRGGRPQLSDLRESGAIEQDADIVMFIHRPDKSNAVKEKDFEEGKVKKNVAEIIIAKHRNGPTGVVELYFKDECTKFLNLNNDTGEPLDEANQQATSRSKEVEGLEDLPVNVEENLQATVKSVDDEIF